MAKISLTGLDEYAKKLDKIGNAAVGVLKASVYVGADELANAVRASIEALPEEDYADVMRDWRERKPSDGLTDKQKQGLLGSLYISTIKDEDGYVYTQIGFAGYNDVKTASYPQGQPNPLIARSLESGSSARKKHPFIRPAVNRVKQTALNRMQQQFETMIDNIDK